MNVLVIGGGGREHALTWKLKQSARVKQVFCAPGNAGVESVAGRAPADVSDSAGLAALAEQVKADLTVVGPELPLVQGVADEFAHRGLKIIGPTPAAAELEGSKVFAKQFMQRHDIPTGDFTACADHGDAYSALCAVDWPVVIKADGLAGGKGVRIANEPDEATAIVEAFMEKGELGAAGESVVLEEYLEGEELSFIVLTDGETILPFPLTRDHKRAFDGDQGPNTGGMGAYSDDALADAALRERILEEIVRPTISGLHEEDRTYRGFLYVGLMLTDDGPKVLEFNCRMGDPECQPLMVRLESDLADVLEKLADGKLVGAELQWAPGASTCVVLASGGYPGKYETGKRIQGLDAAGQTEDVTVFHAGTERSGDHVVTSGGRVLGVTARGADLNTAVERAYGAVEKIGFDGMHYRKDIGRKP
jgi:phosphoribosylamine--glycine ligase